MLDQWNNPSSVEPQLFIDPFGLTAEQTASLTAFDDTIHANPVRALHEFTQAVTAQTPDETAIARLIISTRGSRAISFDARPDIVEKTLRLRKLAEPAGAGAPAEELRINRVEHYIGRVAAFRAAAEPELKVSATQPVESANPAVA